MFYPVNSCLYPWSRRAEDETWQFMRYGDTGVAADRVALTLTPGPLFPLFHAQGIGEAHFCRAGFQRLLL